MTLSNSIQNNLRALVNGQPWYGVSIEDILKKVDFKDLNRKLTADSPSIAGYLKHIIVWKQFILKKLSGDANYDIELGSIEDWPHISIKKEEDFIELKREIVDYSEEIINLIQGWDNVDFKKSVPGKNYTFEYALNGLIQHDVYHLGQIAMIIKYGAK